VVKIHFGFSLPIVVGDILLPGEVVLAVFDTFWPNIGQSGGGAAPDTATVVANATPKIHLRAGAIISALRRLVDLNMQVMTAQMGYPPTKTALLNFGNLIAILLARVSGNREEELQSGPQKE